MSSISEYGEIKGENWIGENAFESLLTLICIPFIDNPRCIFLIWIILARWFSSVNIKHKLLWTYAGYNYSQSMTHGTVYLFHVRGVTVQQNLKNIFM